MLSRFLFGDDIFISYSRRDGASYAAALANELSAPGRDFSCFLDQWGASAASELSGPVLRALRRSSVFVLVGTEGAVSSAMVREEVQRFSKPSRLRGLRPVLIINVGGAFDHIAWTEIAGLHREPETDTARAGGLPSEAVVRRIANSHSYTRRNQRARWLSLAAAALLVISVSASALATWQARLAGKNRVVAEAATRTAQEQTRRAEGQTREAEAQRQQTERQTEIASARLLTAQANLARAQHPDQLPLSVLLAASSMHRLEVLGQREATTDQALREGLALLPAPVRTIDHPAPVTGLAIGPDVVHLATVGQDKKVRVWRLSDGRSSAPIVHQELPVGIAFSPDGRYLATADGVAVQVWDTRDERVVTSTTTPDCHQRSSAGRSPRLIGPAFTADGKRLTLVCTAREGPEETTVARVWEAPGGRELSAERVPHSLVSTLSPDGQSLAVATRVDDASVIVVRSLGGKPSAIQPVNVGDLSVRALALSPSGKYLAVTGSMDGELSTNVFELAAGKQRLGTLGAGANPAFSPYGIYVTTSSAGTTKVFSLPKLDEALTVTYEAQAPRVLFSAYDRHLVVGSGRSVRVWRIRTREEVARVGTPEVVREVAVEPRGKARRRPVHETFFTDKLRAYFATAGSGGAVHVWEFGREAALTSLGFVVSPDGRYVAEAESGAVELWDVLSGAPLAPLKPEGKWWTTAFSPNGTYVATTSRDTFVVQVWEMPLGRAVARSRIPSTSGSAPMERTSPSSPGAGGRLRCVRSSPAPGSGASTIRPSRRQLR